MAGAVRVECRKWPDAPHWEYDATYLGADGHGHWLGVRAGTWLSRPGAGFHAHCDQVVLAPYDAWYVATFYGADPGRPVDTYVDIATPPEFADGVCRTVDLDLDVVKGVTGRVFVDDEDEFAAHRISLGYPDDVVASAVASCDDVTTRVSGERPPFDGVALEWLARFRARSTSDPVQSALPRQHTER